MAEGFVSLDDVRDQVGRVARAWTPAPLDHDLLYIFLNGRLQAENTSLHFWTDASGRHVSGASVLTPKTLEFDFERARADGVPVEVQVLRGCTGERVSFTGIVSSAGMRTAVHEVSTVTFQIDEVRADESHDLAENIATIAAGAQAAAGALAGATSWRDIQGR